MPTSPSRLPQPTPPQLLLKVFHFSSDLKPQTDKAPIKKKIKQAVVCLGLSRGFQRTSPQSVGNRERRSSAAVSTQRLSSGFELKAGGTPKDSFTPPLLIRFVLKHGHTRCQGGVPASPSPPCYSYSSRFAPSGRKFIKIQTPV